MPTKQSKIAKIVDMGRAWWNQIGEETAQEIIFHTKDKHLDVNDNKFDDLSPEYADYKAKGLNRIDPSRNANLWATGDMLSDLKKRRSTATSVVIGWGVTESEKVVHNSNKGRTITKKSKPLSKMVEKFLQKAIDKQTKKNIKKNDTVTVHKLGR